MCVRLLAAPAEAEHFARLRAEAVAQDCANRLRVAQEQLAEYAVQKEADAVAAATQAEQLSEMLQKGPQDAQALAQQVDQLRERLGDAASEAKAFAAQQKADVETLKRSSAQVWVCVWGGGGEGEKAPCAPG